MSDAQHAAELVIQRAQARLDGQSRDNDALDVKALGVVAVDAAIFALLAIVHHDALNSLLSSGTRSTDVGDTLYEIGFRISVIGLIGAGFAPFFR